MYTTAWAVQLISLTVLLMLCVTLLILMCCCVMRLYDQWMGVEYVDMDKKKKEKPQDNIRHKQNLPIVE